MYINVTFSLCTNWIENLKKIIQIYGNFVMGNLQYYNFALLQALCSAWKVKVLAKKYSIIQLWINSWGYIIIFCYTNLQYLWFQCHKHHCWNHSQSIIVKIFITIKVDEWSTTLEAKTTTSIFPAREWGTSGSWGFWTAELPCRLL